MAEFFDGYIYEKLSDCGEKLNSLDPGTKEYAMAAESFVKLAEVQIKSETAAEELEIKHQQLKEEKKKILLTLAKDMLMGAAYVGTGILMVKFNLQEGNAQGRDGLRFFDQLKNLIK